MNIVSPIKEGKIPLDYSMLDIKESLQNTIGTLQVVSFLVFLPENISWICFTHPYAPCDIISVKTMPPSGGHTPSYIVSNSEANQTDSF